MSPSQLHQSNQSYRAPVRAQPTYVQRPQPKYCGNCGTSVLKGTKYCAGCGNQV